MRVRSGSRFPLAYAGVRGVFWRLAPDTSGHAAEHTFFPEALLSPFIHPRLDAGAKGTG